MKSSHSASDRSSASTVLSRIRTKIFIGIMLAMPIMATIWIFNFVLNLTTAWFPTRLFPQLNDILNGYVLQMLVLLGTLLIFYLLGLLAHHFLGKRLYKLADRIFSGIPLVKSIYIFVRQVCEWLAKSRNTSFESVVLVEYPRKGIYTVGLVTSQTASAITSKILDENGQPTACVNVFVSTTPSPSNGMFIIFPKKEVIKLDMDVAEAMNLVLSAGAIPSPKTTTANKNSMIEMIDNLIAKQAERDSLPPSGGVSR